MDLLECTSGSVINMFFLETLSSLRSGKTVFQVVLALKSSSPGQALQHTGIASH